MKVTYIYRGRKNSDRQKRVSRDSQLGEDLSGSGSSFFPRTISLRFSSKSRATVGGMLYTKMRHVVTLLLSVHLACAATGRHLRYFNCGAGDCESGARPIRQEGSFHDLVTDSAFLNHVQMVHEFRCSMPQPRAVPVAELLTVGPSPDEVFYPASTVLTRCDGAGCCPDPKQTCAPIETRNVSLVFTVKHTIDRQRDRHHEVIHALEHTKCGCVDKKMIKFD